MMMIIIISVHLQLPLNASPGDAPGCVCIPQINRIKPGKRGKFNCKYGQWGADGFKQIDERNIWWLLHLIQRAAAGVFLCTLVKNHSPLWCKIFLFADLHEFGGKPVGFERQGALGCLDGIWNQEKKWIVYFYAANKSCFLVFFPSHNNACML